jgi:hypothetical protein
MNGKGSLVLVGTGIKVVGQLTLEAVAWMRRADKLLYVVADAVAEETIRSLNPAGAESMHGFYADGKNRLDTYRQMVERMMSCVRGGLLTCAAFYGHPGVFVYPSHEAMRQARAEGYPARMLPGISAEDCLFADLGIDPAIAGCQAYEATDFLLGQRRIEPASSLILWQVGVVGNWTYQQRGYELNAMPLLLERLLQHYPPEHEVYIYEAAIFPGCEPVIRRVPLIYLGQSGLSAISTLYLPPSQPPNLDLASFYRLDVPASDLTMEQVLSRTVPSIASATPSA